MEREVPKKEVPAIEYGTVIDHIPAHATLTVVRILSELEDLVTIGINLKSNKLTRKGVVKIANRKLSAEEVAKIALVAPQATVNIIERFKVVKKYRVMPPEVLKGIVRCPNPVCITNHENVSTVFSVTTKPDGTIRLKCRYCERIYNKEEVEVI